MLSSQIAEIKLYIFAYPGLSFAYQISVIKAYIYLFCFSSNIVNTGLYVVSTLKKTALFSCHLIIILYVFGVVT